MIKFTATISQDRDEHGFWRVFHYAPGMGFDSGTSVYVGRLQFRDRGQAEAEKAKWEARNTPTLQHSTP